MNFAKLILSCTFIGLLMSLAGCAKKSSYKPRNIQSLKESAHVDYQETKELVTVRAKAFTNFDCDYIFGERADRITEGENKLQPVQVSLENNSSLPVELHDENIDIPLVTTKEIIDRLSSFNYKKAGICCGVGALVAFASAGALIISIPWLFAYMLFGGHASIILGWIIGLYGCAAAGGLLLIATPCMFIIDNCVSEKREIRECIAKTDMGKTIIINPGKTVDVLLFVRKQQFKPTFNIALITQKQNKKHQFTIRLPEQI